MILLITNKNDITTDFVVNELNKRKCQYYRFNTEELSLSVNISLELTKHQYILEDTNRNIRIDLNTIKSVYYRRPELPDYIQLEGGKKQFWKNELYYVLEGIYKILNHKYWISPVFSIREAENKIHQLILAQEIGFKVPPSIISNIPKEAEIFIQTYEGQCIIKPIKVGLIKDDLNPEIVFTSLLEENHIKQLDRISNSPTYFQQHIFKHADVRATVVGNKVFAAKIDSQSCDYTKVDWRRGENINLKYSSIDLPYDLQQKCISLTKRLKLNFGAIDFILDENDGFIFLEINPNGQWGWIEKRLGLGICNEIVELLIMAGEK